VILNKEKQALIVLGMHRSGTSVLSALLARAGFDTPRDLMPATSDNPHGYWESRRIVQANNSLLVAANTHWNDDSQIPANWLTSPERDVDIKAIRNVIRDEYGLSRNLLIKDPRICRLLPLWTQALSQDHITTRCILIHRHPNAVAKSLAARASSKAFAPAAICSHSRSALLWLRYTLDAEKHSRNSERFIVNYDFLLKDWKSCLGQVFDNCWPERINNDIESDISDIIKPNYRHHTIDSSESSHLQEARQILGDTMQWLSCPSNENFDRLDLLKSRLDSLTDHYRGLRLNQDHLCSEDCWSDQILRELAKDSFYYTRPETTKKTAVFVSAATQSIGHIYRVDNIAMALASAGWNTIVKSISDPDTQSHLENADVVVVFRAVANEQFLAIKARCKALGIPTVYNIDDLLFDPAITSSGQIAYLDNLPANEQEQWILNSYKYREALRLCSASILSTEPLKENAIGLSQNIMVVPNIASTEIERRALSACSSSKLSLLDGIQRLVFASGTPTHHRDFHLAAEGIALAFRKIAKARLVIIGHLDISRYDSLKPFADRIELCQAVSYCNLPATIAKYDINLSPLEPSNLFCECKSAVRCMIASLVKVPTISSTTQPSREMIIDKTTGILIKSESPEQWEDAITTLLLDRDEYRKMADACQIDISMRYGFTTWVPRIASIFNRITSSSL
jgi:hypothetical protein